jgi:hypothetical protein
MYLLLLIKNSERESSKIANSYKISIEFINNEFKSQLLRTNIFFEKSIIFV